MLGALRGVLVGVKVETVAVTMTVTLSLYVCSLIQMTLLINDQFAGMLVVSMLALLIQNLFQPSAQSQVVQISP